MDSEDLRDGLLSGAVLGFLLVLKPSNAPLVLAAGAFLVLTRQPRLIGSAAIGIVPSLVALAAWKQRGRGLLFAAPPPHLGSASSPSARSLASAPLPPSAVSASPPNAPHRSLSADLGRTLHHLVDAPGNYVKFDLHHLSENIHALNEVFWSMRLLEFLLVAGIVALLARGRWRGLFVLVWFFSIAIVKGTTRLASVLDTSLYRYLLPAWPAWVVIVASVVLLWPRPDVDRLRTAAADNGSQRSARAPRWLVLAVLAGFGLAPMTVALGASRAPVETIAQMQTGGLIPMIDFGLSATRTGPNAVRLAWHRQSSGSSRAAYLVFSGPTNGCGITTVGTPVCSFQMPRARWTNRTTLIDNPPVGAAVFYRVALTAGWRHDPTIQSNPLLLSRSVVVTR